jgi:hypothetical protein
MKPTSNNTTDSEPSSTPTIYRRINRANRLAEDKVQQAAKALETKPRKENDEIATLCGISRSSVNTIGLLMSRSPELWHRVQSGELSVGTAATMMRRKDQHCVSPNNAITVKVSVETLNDLRAFFSLGREVFERLEKELQN